MKSKLRNLLSGASAVLSLALIVVLVRSLFYYDRLSIVWFDDSLAQPSVISNTFYFQTDVDVIAVAFVREIDPASKYSVLTLNPGCVAAAVEYVHWQCPLVLRWSKGPRQWLIGFDYGWRRDSPHPEQPDALHLGIVDVDFPLWLLILLTAIPPAVHWRSSRRWRRRLLAGQCVHCGYDLRANPGRCSECGKQSTGKPPAAARLAPPDELTVVRELATGNLKHFDWLAARCHARGTCRDAEPPRAP